MPLSTQHILPTERAALLEALRSPTHSLVRAGRAYVARGDRPTTSGDQLVKTFTPRTINRLERDGLVHFEPPRFPERVILNTHGLKLAEQLRAADDAKAGAR
jgi:hypothetical protein